MKKKVLVTGAEGFIGSHLVEELICCGYKVRAMSMYNFQNSTGWLETIDSKIKKNIEFISGDIQDLKFLIDITKGMDYIINLAALISIPYSYISPASYAKVNTLGSLNILESAKINKVSKIVMTSSSEVYGTAQFVPITEKHPLNSQSPYAASKNASDQFSISYHKSYNLPVVILRPFNTFGPRQSTRAIIPTIITQMLKYKTIKLGSVSPTRDFTYVKDTVKAFVQALKIKNINGEIINIGNNFEISISNILNLLKKDFGYDFSVLSEKKRVRPKKSEIMRLLSSSYKAKKLLKWKASYSGLVGFKKALKETINWYKIPENLEKIETKNYNF